MEKYSQAIFCQIVQSQQKTKYLYNPFNCQQEELHEQSDNADEKNAVNLLDKLSTIIK